MPHRRVRLSVDGPELRAGFEAIRTELHVPAAFPPEVLTAAAQAAAHWSAATSTAADQTAVPFLTIDPPGSMDLDQAMHIARVGAGYRVLYAIADVAAFVSPGDPVDVEAHERGETLYSPDMRTPLHPPAIGEAAASLLPNQVRPALVWTLDLDADGRQTVVDVERAVVRSVSRLNYSQAQQMIDAKTGAGAADGTLALLAEVGRLRQALEVERGAVSLRLPEQEVDADDNGFRLRYRAPLPVEDWNAQISLLTGMAAAGIMLGANVGILRTLPPAEDGAIGLLHRVSHALGVPWPKHQAYQAFVRSLDPATGAGAALIELSTRLLRGAGYTAFDGSPPAQPNHSAVAAPYAHATAPLRRLVDRYVGELCVAVCAHVDVPPWIREALPALAEVMADSGHKAHALERACVDLVETALMASDVGETFEGGIVETMKHGAIVQLRTPPVRARCDGEGLLLGAAVDVRLVTADPATRTLLFVPA